MPVPKITRTKLNPIAGWTTGFSNLEYSAKFADAVDDAVKLEGRVVHVNNSGELEMGVPTVAPASGKIYMPLFLFRSGTDADVQPNPGGISGNAGTDVAYGWATGFPDGSITTLVATGAYELESDEYNGTPTYAANDALTAAADNSDVATGGVLDKGTPYTDPIVGIVSRGENANNHTGTDTLTFWPFVLPPSA